MKKIFISLLLSLCVLSSVVSIPAFAEKTTDATSLTSTKSSENAKTEDTKRTEKAKQKKDKVLPTEETTPEFLPVEDPDIYVYVNSDAYPFEYFDSEDNTYYGIAPDILNLIHKNTKYNFIYLSQDNSQNQDNHEWDLAIVSEDEKDTYSSTLEFVNFANSKGKTEKVYFAFSDNANKSFVSNFTTAFGLITDSEKSQVYIDNYFNSYKKNTGSFSNYVIIGLIVLIIALLAVNRIKSIKTRKQKTYCFNVKNLYNYDSLKRKFESQIADSERKNYSAIIVNFSFDYINETIFNSIAQVSDLFISELYDGEFLGYIGDNKLCIFTENSADTKALTEYITNLDIIQRKNLKSSNSYRFVLNYGIYSLSNNDRQFSSIIKKATIACNQAIENNSLYSIYQESLKGNSKKNPALRTTLITAVDKKMFSLLCKPLIDSDKGEIDLIQVIPAYEDTRTGVLKGNDFSDYLIGTSKEEEYSLSILEDVCKWITNNRKPKLSKINFLCPMSITLLEQENFVKNVHALLKKYICNPNKFIFTFSLQDKVSYISPAAETSFHKLKHIGIQTAISVSSEKAISFTQISSLEIGYIVLNKNFLLQCTKDNTSEVFANVFSSIKNSGVKIISQDINTENLIKTAIDIKSDYLQGDMFYSEVNIKSLSSILL